MKLPPDSLQRSSRARVRVLLGVLVAALLALVSFRAPLAHAARAKEPPAHLAPRPGTPLPAPAASSHLAAAEHPGLPPDAPHRAAIAVYAADGSRGPIVLKPAEGAYTAELTIADEGTEALVVSRVAIRGDDEDIRAPARLSAKLADGGTSVTIPPGEKKRVVVTWTPERTSRVRQVFAHVVVTSNDEESGEVAMGVHAQLASWVPFVWDHLLSWLTFLPLAGAVLIVLLQALGKGSDRTPRLVALTATALQCVLALAVAWSFRGDVTRLDGNDGFQLIEHAAWVRSFGVEYFLGIDGLSAPLVLLGALVSLVGCIASARIDKLQPGYYALYLLLATGAMGVFVALDLLLFFVFWEAMLLPLFFLVGIWGGPRREAAATKLLVFLFAGSVALLLAILALYTSSDRTFLADGTTALHTFSIPELTRVSFAGKHLTIFGVAFVKIVWVLLFASFAVKLAMFPLHTWLPDAYAEAPTPVTVVLAAVVLKTGVYGLLRVSFAILPEATRWGAGAMVAFGVVSVVYGALCALAQDDLKRLIAYASVSQMGFCLVGLGSLTPQGIAGGIFLMVSHGIVTSMLFLLAGALEDRVGTRSLRAFGGLAREVPIFAALAGLAFAASLGLPGLSGFWGEALALFGAFPSHRAIAAIGAFGLVLGAAYNLGAFRKIFFGDADAAAGAARPWRTSPSLDAFGGRFPDVTARELASIAPLAVLAVVLGLWPVPLFSLIAGGVRDAVAFVDPAGPDQIASLARDVSHATHALALSTLSARP